MLELVAPIVTHALLGGAAYQTVCVVRSGDEAAYGQWLMYWIVASLFPAAELFGDLLISWLPMYYDAKVLFLVWLTLPRFSGGRRIYEEVLAPYLELYETDIDAHIEVAKAHASSQALSAASGLLRLLMDRGAHALSAGQRMLAASAVASVTEAADQAAAARVDALQPNVRVEELELDEDPRVEELPAVGEEEDVVVVQEADLLGIDDAPATPPRPPPESGSDDEGEERTPEPSVEEVDDDDEEEEPHPVLHNADPVIRVFVDRMSAGVRVKKHGRTGRPKIRLMRVDERFERLEWDSARGDGFVPLGDVKSVVRGRQTPNFERASEKVPDANCLSLITAERSVDIEVPSTEARDVLYAGFRFLVRHNRSTRSSPVPARGGGGGGGGGGQPRRRRK